MSTYSELVAAQLRLDEEQLVEEARVASEDDARGYYEHMRALDTALEGQGLARQIVPGDGDCLYHSLIKTWTRPRLLPQKCR